MGIGTDPRLKMHNIGTITAINMHCVGHRGAFKYYISKLGGGVGGKSHSLILLMRLGEVGGLEAKC